MAGGLNVMPVIVCGYAARTHLLCVKSSRRRIPEPPGSPARDVAHRGQYLYDTVGGRSRGVQAFPVPRDARFLRGRSAARGRAKKSYATVVVLFVHIIIMYL